MAKDSPVILKTTSFQDYISSRPSTHSGRPGMFFLFKTLGTDRGLSSSSKSTIPPHRQSATARSSVNISHTGKSNTDLSRDPRFTRRITIPMSPPLRTKFISRSKDPSAANKSNSNPHFHRELKSVRQVAFIFYVF